MQISPLPRRRLFGRLLRSYGNIRAKNLGEEGREEMRVFPTKILLSTDGSEEAELALRAAAELARATGSELHVVHVLPTDMGIPYPAEVLKREPLQQAEQRAQAFLDQQVERIGVEGVAVTGSYLREGRPANEIVRLRRNWAPA